MFNVSCVTINFAAQMFDQAASSRQTNLIAKANTEALRNKTYPPAEWLSKHPPSNYKLRRALPKRVRAQSGSAGCARAGMAESALLIYFHRPELSRPTP